MYSELTKNGLKLGGWSATALNNFPAEGREEALMSEKFSAEKDQGRPKEIQLSKS